MREAIEHEGYDADRGVFVQAFGSTELDAALLLLPSFDFVAYDDERMVRTTDAVRDELSEGGLLRRYRSDDRLAGTEGVFVACTFWLADCLVHQGRITDAQEAFGRAASTANDLGLFAEEFDPAGRALLGNFPQGLSHLSHIAAASALPDRRYVQLPSGSANSQSSRVISRSRAIKAGGRSMRSVPPLARACCEACTRASSPWESMKLTCRRPTPSLTPRSYCRPNRCSHAILS
jgi:hypothetical protein